MHSIPSHRFVEATAPRLRNAAAVGVALAAAFLICGWPGHTRQTARCLWAALAVAAATLLVARRWTARLAACSPRALGGRRASLAGPPLPEGRGSLAPSRKENGRAAGPVDWQAWAQALSRVAVGATFAYGAAAAAAGIGDGALAGTSVVLTVLGGTLSSQQGLFLWADAAEDAGLPGRTRRQPHRRSCQGEGKCGGPSLLPSSGEGATALGGDALPGPGGTPAGTPADPAPTPAPLLVSVAPLAYWQSLVQPLWRLLMTLGSSRSLGRLRDAVLRQGGAPAYLLLAAASPRGFATAEDALRHSEGNGGR